MLQTLRLSDSSSSYKAALKTHCSVTISKLSSSQPCLFIPPSGVRVLARTRARVFLVLFVKRPALPPCVVDRRCRNPFVVIIIIIPIPVITFLMITLTMTRIPFVNVSLVSQFFALYRVTDPFPPHPPPPYPRPLGEKEKRSHPQNANSFYMSLANYFNLVHINFSLCMIIPQSFKLVDQIFRLLYKFSPKCVPNDPLGDAGTLASGMRNCP